MKRLMCGTPTLTSIAATMRSEMKWSSGKRLLTALLRSYILSIYSKVLLDLNADALRYSHLQSRYAGDPRIDSGRLHQGPIGPHPLGSFELVSHRHLCWPLEPKTAAWPAKWGACPAGLQQACIHQSNVLLPVCPTRNDQHDGTPAYPEWVRPSPRPSSQAGFTALVACHIHILEVAVVLS